MDFSHSINWTTVLLAVAGSLLGGGGAVAIFFKAIERLAQRRIDVKELARHDSFRATEAENVWLRRQVEELNARLDDQENRYELRFTALEGKYAEASEKRHAIANEANALKLENVFQQKELNHLEKKLVGLEKENAKLHEELTEIRDKVEPLL